MPKDFWTNNILLPTLLTNEWFCAMSWEVTNDYLDIRVNETQRKIIYNLYKRTSIPSKPSRFIQHAKLGVAVATQNHWGPLVHGPTRSKGRGLNLRHPRAFSLSLCKSREWRQPGWSLQSFQACVRSYARARARPHTHTHTHTKIDSDCIWYDSFIKYHNSNAADPSASLFDTMIDKVWSKIENLSRYTSVVHRCMRF